MEQQPKVLIVHNYYQIPGGEDTVVANEKKLLEDNGQEVVLYTRDNSEINSMNVLRKLLLPFGMIFNIRTFREIRKIIKTENIDIVHVHNTLNLISPAVYYAALSCKVPVVQTMHNFRLLCPGATFYRDGKICEDCVAQGYRCAIRHGCYRRSRMQTLICVLSTEIHRILGVYEKLNYICLTEFNKKKLLDFKKMKPERIYVKPNFTFPSKVVRHRGEYYLYIGRIETIKGVEMILEAFNSMPDKKLVLAGTGEQLSSLKHKYKESANVRFLGFVEKEPLNELLSKAKAVIVASQCYETFGMVVIEAFASGVPVIVGDIGNIGDLVTDNVDGVKFQYDSVESLVAAVDRFEALENDWDRRVYSVFRKKYGPERNLMLLRNIYQEINEMQNTKALPKRGGGND